MRCAANLSCLSDKAQSSVTAAYIWIICSCISVINKRGRSSMAQTFINAVQYSELINSMFSL